MPDLGFLLGFALSSSIAVTCARAAPGAVPRCVVRERTGFETGTSTFALAPGAIKTATLTRSEDPEVVLQLAGPSATRSSYGASWSEGAAAGAEAFRTDESRMTWEAHASRTGLLVMTGSMSLLFLGFLLLMPFRTRLLLDPNTARVSITTRSLLSGSSSRELGLATVENASVESINESNFVELCLVEKDARTRIAIGGDDSCREAAQAIDQFLVALRVILADGNTYFARWSLMSAAAKEARKDMFLASLPLERGVFEATKNDRGLALSGSKGGIAVRVRLDLSPPRDVEVTVIAHNPRGRMILVQDKTATEQATSGSRRTFYAEHVFIANKAEAKIFETLPEDLRASIVAMMVAEEVSLFAMRGDVIEVRAKLSTTAPDDPVGHISRLLDTATLAASQLSKHGD